MQCPNCFAQLPEGAVSCNYCGSQFYNQMQYTPDYANQQINNPGAYPAYSNYPDSNNMNQYQQGNMPQQPYDYNNYSYNGAAPTGDTTQGGKKKPNTVLLISIISFAIVAFILGIALIIKGGKDKDSKTTEATTTEATTTEEPTTTEATTEATTTEATTTEATTTEEPTTEATVEIDGYKGKYIFSDYVMDGELVSVYDVAQGTGTNLDIYMMIYGNTCLLIAPESGKAYCDFSIVDGVVTIDDGVEPITGTYDEENHTITVVYNETTMIYTREEWDGTTYDMVGDYSLLEAVYGDEVYDLETLREKMGDPNYDITLKVYGALCTLTAFENNSLSVGTSYMEAIGTDLYFEDSQSAIMGKYDPDTKTITMYTNGVDLVFELDEAQ